MSQERLGENQYKYYIKKSKELAEKPSQTYYIKNIFESSWHTVS